MLPALLSNCFTEILPAHWLAHHHGAGAHPASPHCLRRRRLLPRWSCLSRQARLCLRTRRLRLCSARRPRPSWSRRGPSGRAGKRPCPRSRHCCPPARGGQWSCGQRRSSCLFFTQTLHGQVKVPSCPVHDPIGRQYAQFVTICGGKMKRIQGSESGRTLGHPPPCL